MINKTIISAPNSPILQIAAVVGRVVEQLDELCTAKNVKVSVWAIV
jgi:hypothetical protein